MAGMSSRMPSSKRSHGHKHKGGQKSRVADGIKRMAQRKSGR